ncbi:MAG: GAF domain-containing sensor histidine kinase [Chloroflexota bacterium]
MAVRLERQYRAQPLTLQPRANQDLDKPELRAPRTRQFYLVTSLGYAVLTFLVVEIMKAWEAAWATHQTDAIDPATLVASSVSLHGASFAAWVGLCVGAGMIAHRLQSRLDSTLSAEHQRGEELAFISEIGSTLSGPLPPAQIAAEFLRKIRPVIDDGVTAAVMLHDESAGSLRAISADGVLAEQLSHATIPFDALPEPTRQRLARRKPQVLLDVNVAGAAIPGDAWTSLAARVPALKRARYFGLLPLVSRDRLVGALLMRDDQPHSADMEPLQLLGILSHYLAGALHNAVSVSEAESRADRATLINRIAQWTRASDNNHHDVLNRAVEEIGTAISASAAFVRFGVSEDGLRVGYEWVAPDVAPLGISPKAKFPVDSLAIRAGKTVAVSDVHSDPRLEDPSLGRREDLTRGGTVSVLSTPIGLADQLVGTITFHQVDEVRVWSEEDIRLVEAVSRELRISLETARMLEARQRDSDRLLELHRASTEVASLTDSHAVVDAILRSAVTLLGAGSGAFYRWDAQAGVLRRVQSWQAPDADVTTSVQPGEGLAGQTFSEGRPVIVNDYQTSAMARRNDVDRGLRAGLGVPLIPSGTPLGVLVVSSYDETTHFTEDDARLLELFGDQASAALLTAEAFERQQKAVGELERLNKEKSNFVAIVSHEFRTPLTGIQGFSEMMRDDDLTADEMREYASDINKDARRLNRLVTEMLDLSRMESGRMTLNLERLDLNGIVTEVATHIQHNSPKHTIAVRVSSKIPALTGDRDKLTQVITNLLNNAVKYSPDGTAIEVATRLGTDVAHVTVTDHGIGIPSDALETIFEPYSRVESGPSRYIGGTGLGLPIVRQIAQLHGGKAWAESRLGEGSTFHFTVPLAGVPAPVRAA